MPEDEPIARSPIDPGPSTRVVDGWKVRSAQDQDARPGGTRHTRSQVGAPPPCERLTLTDCTPLTKVLLRADAGAPTAADLLGVPLGRSAKRLWDLGTGEAHVLLAGSRPGQWLALAPPHTAGAVTERLQKVTAPLTELVSVVDLTHALALVRLTGRAARTLLGRECGADLRPGHFPDGSTLGTVVAGVAVDVIRDDLRSPDESFPSFLLHCEWMTGQYLVTSLIDAGEELGLEQTGLQPSRV
ncbi:MAG TPA: sarcosine oxidase subunit gamma family protein [Segeticoccus sp.]|nr:sarcosine oxidase subunit gamma family protein [Segeticoccus sp.]